MDATAVVDDPMSISRNAVFVDAADSRPSLRRCSGVGVQNSDVPPGLASEFCAAADHALARLQARLLRLQERGVLGDRTVREAACEFHALCEGLAALVRRGAPTAGEEEHIWQDSLTALVSGFASANRVTDKQHPASAEPSQ